METVDSFLSCKNGFILDRLIYSKARRRQTKVQDGKLINVELSRRDRRTGEIYEGLWYDGRKEGGLMKRKRALTERSICGGDILVTFRKQKRRKRKNWNGKISATMDDFLAEWLVHLMKSIGSRQLLWCFKLSGCQTKRWAKSVHGGIPLLCPFNA